MLKIILIHGINNQNNSKAKIEANWIKAFKLGAKAANVAFPEPFEVNAAFYGDLLFNETKSWGIENNTLKPMSADSSLDEYVNDDVASLYLEYQKLFKISDEQIKTELNPADNVSYQRMANGVHKNWLKALTRVLEKVLPSSAEKRAIKAFLPQAAAYLHKPGLKDQIDTLVELQVLSSLSKDDEILIISHSLGTIIAYTLLLRLREKFDVRHLLTAGSPLGIEIVKRRLGPPLICLPNVTSWINVSDKEDFVALKPELNKQTFGCNNITNIVGIDNGDEDAHDIRKYLAHAVVAKKLL